MTIIVTNRILAFTMLILSGRVEQDKAESALYNSLVLERTSIYRRYRQRLGVLSVEDSEKSTATSATIILAYLNGGVFASR
jgi:hypothetical protein